MNKLAKLEAKILQDANQQYHRRVDGNWVLLIIRCWVDIESFKRYCGEILMPDGRRCHNSSEYERHPLTSPHGEVFGNFKYYRDVSLKHPCYNCYQIYQDNEQKLKELSDLIVTLKAKKVFVPETTTKAQ